MAWGVVKEERNLDVWRRHPGGLGSSGAGRGHVALRCGGGGRVVHG